MNLMKNPILFLSLAALLPLSCSHAGALAPVASNTTLQQPLAVVPNVTMVGKVMSGYQGWFNAEGDGAARGWHHFGPTPGKVGFDMWPDMTELGPDERFDTGFKLRDGSTAQLYSAYNEKTVLRHFKWMRDYGLDGVFLQRFYGEVVNNPAGKNHFNHVLQSAQKGAAQYGRVYGVMYDLSGARDGCADSVIADWKELVDTQGITKDARYVRHNNKPVVVLWGLGFGGNRPPLLDDGLKIVNFLKRDAVYGGNVVMLGVPYQWRTTDTAQVPFAKMEKLVSAADIVSPWAVGTKTTPAAAEQQSEKVLKPDLQWCQAHGKEYMPVVFPGFSWYNLRHGHTPSNQIPRLGGQFLWTQYVAAKRAGANMIYQAMFDEVDEGTAIFKVTNDVPPAQGGSQFVPLEGLPSDFYLRLVGQASRLVRGEIKPEDDTLVKNAKWTPVVAELPVVPAVKIEAQGAAWHVKTDNYEATVDADGMLPSLKINGQEFLVTSPNIPRGFYLYQNGVVKLSQTAQQGDNVLLAQNDKLSLRYEFGPQSITITATNKAATSLPYYAAFDPKVNVFFNNAGNVVKKVGNQDNQKTTTWFRDKAKLTLEGGDKILGPWGGDKLQIWQATLAPDSTRTVTLTAGTATLEDLAKIAAAPDVAALPAGPQAADIAAPKLVADGTMNEGFQKAHESFLARAKAGPIGLLFVGDSITNRWRGNNVADIWKRFEPYQPANFGIEGDKTQNVLWRFDNGELDGINPKVVVLMLGTNNISARNTTDEIVRADAKVVAEIHRRLPNTKVLLLGIFPRGAQPTDSMRLKVQEVNAGLAKLDDGNKTRYLDFGSKFLEADGSISKEMMPDSLHPTPKGYQIWADAMSPLLDEMMK